MDLKKVRKNKSHTLWPSIPKVIEFVQARPTIGYNESIYVQKSMKIQIQGQKSTGHNSFPICFNSQKHKVQMGKNYS